MRIPMLSGAAALALVALAAPAALATDRTVGPTGQYSTIQAGINAAVNGDTVLVQDATYTGSGNRNINFGGKAITVKSIDGPDNCIIDIESAGGNRGFNFASGESVTSMVEGFTIRGGQINSAGGDGGGIRCANGSGPIIRNCVIEDCYADGKGGAIYCDSSAPVIEDCVLQYNSAGNNGGGLALIGGSHAAVVDCIIENNDSGGDGGGVFIYGGSDPTFYGCSISYNTADGPSAAGGGIAAHGSASLVYFLDCSISHNVATSNSSGGSAGGVLVHEATVNMDNCIINENDSISSSGLGGGGLVFEGGDLTLRSCVVYGNSVETIYGGGFFVTGGAATSLTLRNTILWANTNAAGLDQIRTYSSPTVSVQYSCVQGGYTGTGNLTGSELSTDPLDTDHVHLTSGSACIDSGNDADADEWDVDVDGEDRIQGSATDIGVDEVE